MMPISFYAPGSQGIAKLLRRQESHFGRALSHLDFFTLQASQLIHVSILSPDWMNDALDGTLDRLIRTLLTAF